MMATQEVIKKFKTTNAELPPLSAETEGYSVRYRIISSDKNRTSHWSPVYLLQPGYIFVPGDIVFNKAGSIASIVWDAVEITKVEGADTYSIRKALEYDFWVRWDRGGNDGDWLYKERIETTSLSMPIPSTWTINGVVQPTNPNRMSIEIYLKGEPIERADGPVGTPFLKVYRLLNETV
jgi:hypothetical protein